MALRSLWLGGCRVTDAAQPMNYWQAQTEALKRGLSEPGAHLPEHTRRTLPPSLDLTWLNTILSASGDACADKTVLFSDTQSQGNR